MATLLPEGKQSFTNSAGAPLIGGKLYTYDAGTSTPRTTYQDAAGTVPNTNPIILDARGEATIFWSGAYKVVLKDSADVIIWVVDNVSSDTLRTDLANASDPAKGAGMVGFQQEGMGAVSTTVQNKLRETVSVSDFGAVGGGAVDDSTAFTKAFASLGEKGGIVRYYDKHLLDSSITIPTNVTLKGPMSMVGSPGINTSAPYGRMAALIVNSTATISLSSGAGVDGCLIYRKGMAFPSLNSSAFAGTAITAIGDDCFAVNSQVLGFNKAYYSNGFQRPRVQNFWFDCTNGIEIQTCYDVSHIRNCHGWPFATIAQYALDTTNEAVIQRSGAAYYFHDVGDWNKVTDCFSYAYYRGFMLVNVDSMTLMSCSADSTGGYTGQYGFVISGTSLDTRLIACQAAAQDIGYYIDTGVNTHTRMTGCDSWACTNHGVYNANGDFSVSGGTQRNTANGITIGNAAASAFIDNVRFTGLTSRPINMTVGNEKIHIGDGNDYGSWPAGQSVVPSSNKLIYSQALADPLIIPANIKACRLAVGAPDLGSINVGWEGRELTLYFTSPVTVYHGGAAPTGLKLSGSGNFAAIADSTLTLRYDGSFWYEIGRKA